MLAPVTDAIQRFRRRLQVATFVRAMTVGCFVGLVVVAGVLIAERFAPEQVVATWPGWALWGGVAVAGLLSGAIGVRRRAFDDETVVQHLEQRLGTDGLLLAASQGIELDPSYERQLVKRLGEAATALPAIRWQHLLMRPLAAALLLVIAQQLPSEIASKSHNEALGVAVDRLAQEVEEIAQLEGVPDQQVEELRQAVQELKERAEAKDDGLWREVDQLQERIDREEQLAAAEEGGANAPGGSSDPGDATAEAGSGQKLMDAAKIAGAMTRLGKLDKQAKLDGALLDKVMQALPEDLQGAQKQAIKDVLQKGGDVAAEDLPADAESRQALAKAMAEATAELGGDENALAEMMGSGSEAQQEAVAEELASLAKEFANAEPPAGGDPQGASAEQLTAALTEDVAEAAAELAEAGALDQLPEGLREAMVDAGLSALENMDLQKLMSLLPEDLSQLTVMAEKLADVAENMSGEAGGSGDLPKPSEAMQKKMAELAKGLMDKLGRQAGQLGDQPGGSQPGGSQPGGSQAGGSQAGGSQAGGSQAGGAQSGGQPGGNRRGPGMAGMASAPGQQPGGGTEGGGHAALRLTEDTQGGLGTVDVELPGRDPEDLPKEWVPATVDKAKPEVGKTRTAGAGRGGATGSGTATWQLRLMPRHRDVVRRFFAEKDKKNK